MSTATHVADQVCEDVENDSTDELVTPCRPDQRCGVAKMLAVNKENTFTSLAHARRQVTKWLQPQTSKRDYHATFFGFVVRVGQFRARDGPCNLCRCTT